VAVDRAAGMPWDPAAIRHGQDFMMMRLGQKTVRYLDVRQEALARAARVGVDAAANAQAGPRPSTVIRVRHLVPALPGRKVMGGDCPF
jgi:hypothetical protein